MPAICELAGHPYKSSSKIISRSTREIQPIQELTEKHCWINKDKKPKLSNQTSYKLQNISMHFNEVVVFLKKSNGKLCICLNHTRMPHLP